MRGLIEFFSTALGHMYVMRLDQIACLQPYQHLIITLRGEHIHVFAKDWPSVAAAFRAAYGEPPAAEPPPAEQDNAALNYSASPISVSSACSSISIEEFELSTRTYNCLKKAGIHTIGDLVQKEERDLLVLRNFGRVSLAEVKALLTNLNLRFGMKVNQ